MTQDELWLAKWQEAIDFLETYHRKPSKFIPEERNMRSWWKHNKKLMNAGELKAERVEMFSKKAVFWSGPALVNVVGRCYPAICVDR